MPEDAIPPEDADPSLLEASELHKLRAAFLGESSGQGTSAGRRWEPPTVEELQKLLPQYEISAFLGRGGMGAVYKGRQVSLDRLVAIKILSNDLADGGFVDRFKNEARAMARLTHPGIVAVYDFGETRHGQLYIVMEFVEGTDVARMVEASGRLHTAHAVAITAHVCDALAYAHERGIIHRDIKPANVMVGNDGVVKVADFGLAKVNVAGETLGLTQSGTTMGTLHFMAPEALTLCTAVDHRADIYAVGVMLYQMLTGKLPHGMFELPSMQVPGLDPRHDQIIAQAMREDRDARYQTARQMRLDLDAIQTQPVPRVEAGTAAPPTGVRPQHVEGQPQPPTPAGVQPGGKRSGLVLAVVNLGVLLAAWAIVNFVFGKFTREAAEPAGKAVPAGPPPLPATSPPVADADGWKDLLAVIDVEKAALAGEWALVNGELRCTAATAWPICELPVDYEGGSYDLKVSVTRGEGSQIGIHFGVRKEKFGGLVVFDYHNSGDFYKGQKVAGLDHIAGINSWYGNPTRAVRSQWLPMGVRKTVLIQVRDEGLVVRLDDEEVIRWKGDWSQVEQREYKMISPVNGRPLFSVGPYRGLAVYHSAKIREVTGEEAKALPLR